MDAAPVAAGADDGAAGASSSIGTEAAARGRDGDGDGDGGKMSAGSKQSSPGKRKKGGFCVVS